MTFVGETFSKRHVFTVEDIADFATRAGDMNPLHHDAELAAKSRFGGLIASGPQACALLMGLAAAHTSKTHETAGLEFTFRFRRAIPVGADTVLSWTITAIEPNAKLGGEVLTCVGAIADASGQQYVTAEGRAVIWPKAADPAQ
jgi:acyl dehydratase